VNSSQRILGPGTLRVGRFIGRLGVVSLPALEAGLDLDQRVVRRHVAKLEATGCLARAPWSWGEGSVAWLTRMGVEYTGLAGLRPVKSPPAPTTIAHGVLVGWSAARVERRGRAWKSARELAVDPEQWAVTIRCERGYTEQLPDLAVWLKHGTRPVAVIVETGTRREDRQKMILEGWRDAIWSGRYAGVHYDCATGSVARWIGRLGTKVWLTPSEITAAVQMTGDKIAALPHAAADDEVAADDPAGATNMAPMPVDEIKSTSVRQPLSPAPVRTVPDEPPPTPPTETPEAAAERERRYREIFGLPEPKPRRRWRRSA
jgi:hypothetical protein